MSSGTAAARSAPSRCRRCCADRRLVRRVWAGIAHGPMVGGLPAGARAGTSHRHDSGPCSRHIRGHRQAQPGLWPRQPASRVAGGPTGLTIPCLISHIRHTSPTGPQDTGRTNVVTFRTSRASMPRGLRRFTTATAAATTAATTVFGALLLGAPLLADPHGTEVTGVGITLAATHSRVGRPWPGHPGRRLLPHTVRRGETATGLAVRYHAWTRELIRLNHLGSSGALATGRHIRIPVVLSALPAKHRHHPRKKAQKSHSHHHTTHHPWRHDHADRRTVRHTVVRTAKRHEVDPDLAL